MCAQPPPRAGDDGFTLLETLVALTILSLSVAVLFGIFSQALDRGRSDRDTMNARVLAQSVLAQAQSSPPHADWHGSDGEGRSWTLHVAPADDQEKSTAGMHAERLTATVNWAAGPQQKSVRLSTLAVVPGEIGR